MDDNKTRFLQIYRENVTRTGSGTVLDYLCKSDFFTAPASTRFHGAHEGGLLEHSLNVYDCLTQLLEVNGLTGSYSPDTVAVVALLHDICKVNFYKKGTKNQKINGKWETVDCYEIDEKFPCGHGEKSVIILQTMMHLSSEEILAIRAHMGGFDTSVKGGDYFIGKIFERSRLALLLHLADMEATYLKERECT